MPSQKRSPFWIAVAPAVVIYMLFTVWPMVQVFSAAFTDARSLGVNGGGDPVGFANFVKLFTDDEELGDAAMHTLIYALCVVGAQLILAFLIAVLLSKRVRGISLYRAAFFAPIVVSPVAIVFTWSFMFDPGQGTINTTLRDIGLGFLAQDWLGNYDIALFSVILVDIWASIGFSIVIFLAGLSTIPQEVTEAAIVDGASSWRTMVSITMPLMKPAFGLVGVLAINGGLRAFDTVYLMTQGGPGTTTELLMTRTFDDAFVRNQFGYASAVATVLVVVLILVAALQQRLDSRVAKGA